MCWYHPVCPDTMVPEQLFILIFSHRLWLMFVPLITARHLVFLAQIPAHGSNHCVMSLLVLVLCQCWAFTGNVVDGFIFLVAFSTFKGDVSSIHGSLNVSCSWCLILCSHYDPFCLFLEFPSLKPLPSIIAGHVFGLP